MSVDFAAGVAALAQEYEAPSTDRAPRCSRATSIAKWVNAFQVVQDVSQEAEQRATERAHQQQTEEEAEKEVEAAVIAALNSESAVKQRRSNRNHIYMVGALRQWWDSVDKDENGEVGKKEYFAMVEKLYKVISPEDECVEYEAIEEDWNRDRLGRDTINYSMMADAIFELVDLWVNSTDPAEYVHFLEDVTSLALGRQYHHRPPATSLVNGTSTPSIELPKLNHNPLPPAKTPVPIPVKSQARSSPSPCPGPKEVHLEQSEGLYSKGDDASMDEIPQVPSLHSNSKQLEPLVPTLEPRVSRDTFPTSLPMAVKPQELPLSAKRDEEPQEPPLRPQTRSQDQPLASTQCGINDSVHESGECVHQSPHQHPPSPVAAPPLARVHTTSYHTPQRHTRASFPTSAPSPLVMRDVRPLTLNSYRSDCSTDRSYPDYSGSFWRPAKTDGAKMRLLPARLLVHERLSARYVAHNLPDTPSRRSWKTLVGQAISDMKPKPGADFAGTTSKEAADMKSTSQRTRPSLKEGLPSLVTPPPTQNLFCTGVPMIGPRQDHRRIHNTQPKQQDFATLEAFLMANLSLSDSHFQSMLAGSPPTGSNHRPATTAHPTPDAHPGFSKSNRRKSTGSLLPMYAYQKKQSNQGASCMPYGHIPPPPTSSSSSRGPDGCTFLQFPDIGSHNHGSQKFKPRGGIRASLSFDDLYVLGNSGDPSATATRRLRAHGIRH